MFAEFDLLLQRLADPEYLHLVLEGLPLYGGLVCLVGLLLAGLLRQQRMRVVLALLLALSFGAAIPAQELRQQALPRVLATHDAARRSLIEEQTSRRGDFQWLFLAIALLALVALVLGRLPGFGTAVNLLLVAAAAFGVVTALWLHMKEAEIHHRNIVKPVASGTDHTTDAGSTSAVRITSRGGVKLFSDPRT